MMNLLKTLKYKEYNMNKKTFYVYEYVYDVINNTYTHLEGDIIWFGFAKSTEHARDLANCNDFNKFGVRAISINTIKTKINNEILALNKLLDKISDLDKN